MATEKESSSHNYCANDPNFAIICSFFDRFGASCGISCPTFSELQEMIECSLDVPPELIDIHVKLLRKIRKSVSAEKWERALVKFCHSYYCSEDGWELERCGYKNCKVPVKLRILKTLLDAQFDLNSKFKTDINKLTAEELRIEPLGKDKVGQSYWCQFDSAANVRVYKEDQDEETWKMVAKDREGLVDLITQLSSGEELLGLEIINEDSNSQEVEKPIIDTGQAEINTSEENTTDNTSSVDIKTEENIKEEGLSNSDGPFDNGATGKTNGAIMISKEEADLNENGLNSKETPTTFTEVLKSGKDHAGYVDIKTNPDDSKCEALKRDNVVDSEVKDTASNGAIDTNPIKSSLEKLNESSEDFSDTKCSAKENNNEESKLLLISNSDSASNQTLDQSNLDVTEEIKQRSLVKSNNSPLFKGKTSRPSSGSKLDIIFSRKLEQNFPTEDAKALKSESCKENSENDLCNIDDESSKQKYVHDTAKEGNTYPLEINSTVKRKPEEENLDQPLKKKCIDLEPDDEVGEEIEEPLMIIKGEGSGHDCDTGNPNGEEECVKPTDGQSNPPSETANIKQKISNLEKNSSVTCEEHSKEIELNSNNAPHENLVIDEMRSDKDLTDLKNKKLCELENQSNQNSKEVKDISDMPACEQSSGAHDSSADADKSIEEQLSFLTGESLSPKCNDGEHNNLEQQNCSNTIKSNDHAPRRKSLDTSEMGDNEAIPPEAKKTKVNEENIDIFGDKISDNSNELVKSDEKLKSNPVKATNIDDLKSISAIENKLENKSSVESEFQESSINSTLLNCKPDTSNTSERLLSVSSDHADLSQVNEKHENNIEPKVSSNTNQESTLSVEKETDSDDNIKSTNRDKKSVREEDNDPSFVQDEEKSNADCDNLMKKSNKNSESGLESKEKESGDEHSESNCNAEDNSIVNESITNSNNNLASNSEKSCEKPANGKTAVPKKSPKPRKKIFTPRSKKRNKKSQANKSNKEKELNSPEKNDIPKKEDFSIKETISDISSKDEAKHDNEPKPISNRKRRSSCKKSGTEKDSDDDTVSDKKNNTKTEETEIGGKRRKLKGKRAPNKTLRKSVEEKRNSKSSCEEENSNDSEDIDSKKSGCGGTIPRERSKISKGNSSEPTSGTDEPALAKKKKSQGRNSRAFSGIDLNVDINATSRSVRQSSRLAQLKIKEQADNKHGTEDHKSQEKKTKKNKDIDGKKQKRNSKKKNKHKDESEDYQDDEPLSDRKKGKKKKKKMHPARAFDERDPWKSTSGSSSEAEDEEEDHFDDIVEEEDEFKVNLKSDHEFSPESDVEDEDYKPVRRARTAKKVEPSKEDGEELKKMDDFACEKCGKKDHPEWILLCDTCDHGWHASCLRPSLMLVPEGDWHCPPCQHTLLVKELQETLRTYDKNAKKRENEELRKKRLAYVGISLDNVLPHQIQQSRERRRKSCSESSEVSESESESESEDSDEPVYQLRQRRQGTTSYRFNEFDDLINSAIQDEVNAVLEPGAAIIQTTTGKEEEGKVEETKTLEKNELGGAEVAKTTLGIENREKKIKKTDEEDSDEGSSESEEEAEEEEFPSVVPKRNKVLPRSKKKHRRLNCLDDPSDDDDGSDEDFKGSSSDEEEEDEEEYSDDSDIGRRGRSKRGSMVPVRRSSRARRSRIDKEFINDDSEESDAPRRKKTKKLWSESDSESDDSTWGKRKKKKSFGGSGRKKFQKNKRFTIDDELSENESSKVPKKKRQRKIKYGGLDDLEVEELPTRRTRGRQINYQEVIGSDSDEGVLKSKSFKKAVIKDDEEEDEFVAEKEEKDETGSSEEEEYAEDEEKSSDNEEESGDAETSIKEDKKEEKPKQDVVPNVAPPNKAPPPNKVSPPSKIPPANNTPPKNINNEKPVPKRRGRPPKAMIAPPPERLITEDERYKAVVSKVSTLGHSDSDNSTTTPVKGQGAPLDPKFMNRSPPIKIRSGVPVNAGGRKSPLNDPLFFPTKLGPSQSENTAFPLQMQRTLVPFHPGPQSFTARKSINPSGPSIKTENDDVDELDEDYMDDIEEDEDEDNSDDDVLEEGEIPKKVAKRMAMMEERMMQREQARIKQESQPASPVSAQPAANTPSTVEQKPLLRVVSPLKLMANPPVPLQTPFMHSRMGPRMQMPLSARMPMQMRPPPPHGPGGMMQPAEDGSPGKRRGRGRGKKQGPDKPEQEIMAAGPGGGSVIRGMLQQQQPYQYPQQYPPPHPRIPFNPQRMPRPPFHPGHHPMDPSPSGGGSITVKQEPSGGPSGHPPTSSPVQIPGKPPPSSAAPYHPPPPPQHRYDSGPPRPPNYPPQGNPPPRPPYGSYPPGPGANYHYGSYPPPQEPQPYPVQQPYSEQFSEPPAPPAPATPPPLQAPTANKTFNEEESGGEFGGLVSYFSSQREDDIDT